MRNLTRLLYFISIGISIFTQYLGNTIIPEFKNMGIVIAVCLGVGTTHDYIYDYFIKRRINKNGQR